MKPKEELQDVLDEILALLAPATTHKVAPAEQSDPSPAAPSLQEEWPRGNHIEDRWWTQQDADRRWIASQELEGQWPDIQDEEER